VALKGTSAASRVKFIFYRSIQLYFAFHDLTHPQMALEEEIEAPKARKVSKEEFDIISNRLAVALAKRESLIKSWTASSSRPQPPSKTQEELDAEDAALFRNQPPYLGVGAPIPAHFLVSDAERNSKSLRAKFFPTKGLKASKARDAEEKAASAKRATREEDSDEEQGRSGLGRAKKLRTRTKTIPVAAASNETAEDEKALQFKASPMVGDKPENSESKSTKPKVDEIEEVDIPNKSLNGVNKGSSTDVPEEDTEMADSTEKIKQVDNAPPSGSSQNHVMDRQERKRMKKREKKKRAKLRAAQLASQQNQEV